MNSNQDPLSQIRLLTKTLLISGAFNIFLLALLFYFLIKETPPRPYFELKPASHEELQVPLASDASSRQLIRAMRNLSIEQLIAKLTDKQLVENGYTQRDLALSALVAFHQFDLPRALLGKVQPLQQRRLLFGKNRDGSPVFIIVYPGLSEDQYQAIVQFAKTERWPVTSRGIFLLLRKQADKVDPSLVDTFFLTPEFLAVETLFNRSHAHVQKQELLKILMQGNWKLLTTFFEQQKIAQDLSPARRQRLLLDYIENESKGAAYLLLKTDGVFALNKLDDAHILAILKLLTDKTSESEKFSILLLTRPRGDAVLNAAAVRLYEYAGESVPEKDPYLSALAKFVPQAAAVMVKKEQAKAAAKKSTQPEGIQKKTMTSVVAKRSVIKTPSTPVPKAKPATQVAVATVKPSLYIVQEGDSLWKISRRFKVDIEKLKKYNKLQSDNLKPGTTLKIPQ